MLSLPLASFFRRPSFPTAASHRFSVGWKQLEKRDYSSSRSSKMEQDKDQGEDEKGQLKDSVPMMKGDDGNDGSGGSSSSSATTFDWDLFSDLMNDVLQFCTGVCRKDAEDIFQVRVKSGYVSGPEWKGTVYEKRILLVWKAKDMLILKEEHLGSPQHGGDSSEATVLQRRQRSHWDMLEKAFSNYDLRALPGKSRWKAEVSLAKPGSAPFQLCYRSH